VSLQSPFLIILKLLVHEEMYVLFILQSFKFVFILQHVAGMESDPSLSKLASSVESTDETKKRSELRRTNRRRKLSRTRKSTVTHRLNVSGHMSPDFFTHLLYIEISFL
jgi:hypothetical protein